ncbi:carbohydrate esterase family 5 protein [Thelonectria olida]|uniref:Carbohydrate esterase family 5 protein n=1 Tax=Thelonectria olida TaxID=1576542 RepID=A0A9P9ARV5_9HYPO|nr:carbohydrate esterase family 5 protein [Thelonectria olida]
MLRLNTIVGLLFANGLLPTTARVVERSCPDIHVFGARETTVSAGYGSAGTVVTSILNAHTGATSEAIVYPACGGQSSCGGISYANSVVAGTSAVATAVNSFHQQCPTTKLVLVGYSQGGQIMDNALCGGGDPNQGLYDTSVPISASALSMVKAAIFMGNPRYIYGLSYEVGTCTEYGFDPRPSGFVCPSASKIQSYCDSPDPYCCRGSDAAHHQAYGSIYGQTALAFVNGRLAS